MTAQEVKRKLTAILSADVKGYSRLMSEDETGTIRTLSAYKEIIAGLIQQHHGRVVDAPGDNLLAEFVSVVDAVQSAVGIQKELKARNADLSENRRMEFRIGVNLGDVVEEEGKIFGDGVNIAARLESLSDAGGICISGTAFDQVRNKLELGYEYLGEQPVKNIPLPVRVYRILMQPEAAGKVIGEKKVRPRQWQRVTLAVVAVLVVIAAAFVVWRLYLRPAPPTEVASKEKMAHPLPDKPSIAVLPFVNMSGDKEQEYFSDGVSEEIINALVRWPTILVIPRSSSFIYKGKTVDAKQVGREMGVRYVLEGSVRREGDRVRITAQLIDTTTLQHLFSERYERGMRDIFAIQDEITMKILTAMRVSLSGDGVPSSRSKGTKNIEAYLKLLQAEAILQNVNRASQAQARRLAEEAIALDPEYARAHAVMAATIGNEVLIGVYKNPREALERAIALGEKAVQLDDSEEMAYGVVGFLALLNRDYEKAVARAKRAVELAPNSVMGQTRLGYFLYSAGRTEEAIPILEKAVTLNPIPLPRALSHLGIAYRKARRYEEAVAICRQLIQREPNYIFPHLTLAATFVEIEKMEEARAEINEVLRIDPKYTVEVVPRSFPWKDRDEIDRLIDSLRKAGLPEKPSASIPPSAEVAPKQRAPSQSPEKITKPPPVPRMEVASKEKMAFPLPDKPSIAVLPFVNMSGDPKKDYLSDGITEEIINALSKIPSVFVIARNSTFTYKGKPVKVQQVSEEMGVQYVMEGSVQWSGDRVRITVQLIDALKGYHLFSERYDRELKDIFALQDEITKKALMGMRVALRGDDATASEKGTKSLDAYLKLLQAWEHMNVMNKDKMALARPLVEESLALDPGNAFAYAALAHVTILEVYVGASKSPRESLDRAEELAKKALALDDSHYYPYTVLSLAYRFNKQFDKAIPPPEKAVALSPNSALACFMLGAALYGSERFEEAISYFKKSLRLSPIPVGQSLNNLAGAYRFLGRYDESIATYKKLLQLQPDYLPTHANLAAVYVLVGRQEEARAEAAEVMRIDPQFSLERYAKTIPLRQALVDQMVENLRKAGLK